MRHVGFGFSFFILFSACNPFGGKGSSGGAFNPGGPQPSALNSTISASGPVVADGVQTATVTITLNDANNLPMTGFVPTFSATDTGATNGYNNCTSSNSSGVSTCTFTSTVAELKQLNLLSPVSITAGGAVSFIAGSPVAATSTVSGSGPVTADGVSTSSVSIYLADAFNNPIAGVLPTFDATDTGLTNTYGACSATNGSGVATCTLSSTVAESKTLQITSPINDTGTAVSFVAGAVSTLTSDIAGTGPVTANGVATSTVTITLLDAFSNPIVGTTPTFSATDTGTTNSYSSCSVSNGSGISTCTFSSTKAETKTLSIQTPLVDVGSTVSFVAGAAVIANSSISGTGPVTADGVSTSTITVNLGDAFNNPVSGVTPTFDATDTGATNSYGACSVSDILGVSNCTLSSTKAESKTLQLLTPVILSSTSPVVFEAGPASIANSNITGTGPIVANGVATSSVSVSLLDAFNNPLVGVVPTFSATDTGVTNSYGVCSASDSSGNSTCTLASQYAETKTLAIASPIADNGGTVNFTSAGLDLVVPIEMVGYGLSSSTTAGGITFERSRTRLNTNDYVASTNSYFFEVIASNSNATLSYAVDLVNSAGTVLATNTIPNNTTAVKRFRTSFTPTVGADTYRVKLAQTAANDQLRAFTARIIVKQVDATETKLYVPLVNAAFNASSRTTTQSVATTTSTTDTLTGDLFSYFRRDDSKYKTIATTNAWTLESVVDSNNASGTTTVSLYNVTGNSQVTGTEASSSGTTISNIVSTFSSSALNFSDLTNYEVRYRTNNASFTSRIYKSGLWIKLENLTKADVHYRIAMARASVGSTSILEHQRILYEGNEYSNPDVYFESTARCNGACTGSVEALNHTSNDSGTAGVASLTGALISLTTTKTLDRTSAITAPAHSDRIISRHNRSAGNVVLNNAFLVIGIDQL